MASNITTPGRSRPGPRRTRPKARLSPVGVNLAIARWRAAVPKADRKRKGLPRKRHLGRERGSRLSLPRGGVRRTLRWRTRERLLHRIAAPALCRTAPRQLLCRGSVHSSRRLRVWGSGG